MSGAEISRQILSKTKEMTPTERKKFSRILEKELAAAVQRTERQYQKTKGSENDG